MQKQAIDTNVQVEQTRRLLRRSRHPQLEGRAEAGVPEPIENIVVKDLIYEGEDPIFQGLMLKSAPVFTFPDKIELRNLTSNKLVVALNRINQILLTDLLNSTEALSIRGTKKLQKLNVKELVVLQTLNNIPQTLLEPPAADRPLELTDGFEFQGEINVKSLNVKTLNGFDVNDILENVFLKNERTELRGNLILRNMTNVNQLKTNQLRDIPVSNFMTTSTNQTVKANVKINKFYVRKLTTNTINNEKLSQIVATIDNPNVVEGKKHLVEAFIKRLLISFCSLSSNTVYDGSHSKESQH